MAEKMHAIVLHAPNEYEYEEVDIPEVGEDEVLVKIKAISICGSDPHVFDGGYLSIGWPPSFPFTPGHEFSGEVVKLGKNVTKFQVGDRVAGEAHCGCGHCDNCKKGMYNLCLNYGKVEEGHRHYGFTYRGAYADYNAYNVKALTKIPDNVTYEEASLADTAGTSLQAIRLTGIVPGGWTVVIGPGPIGMFCMEIAKAMGSRTIMVGRGHRLEIAGELGADVLINFEEVDDVVKAIREATGGVGVDQAFDAAGTKDSAAQCVYACRKNGQVAIVALPTSDMHELPTKTMTMNQIHVHGSRANPNCCEEVLKYMSEGKINAKGMITHVLPLSDFHHAMEVFTKRLDGAMKVVVCPEA